MKIEQEHPALMDPEIEAKELEHALHDMSKIIREANKKLGKSGLSYSEFKDRFLTTIAISDLAHAKNH